MDSADLVIVGGGAAGLAAAIAAGERKGGRRVVLLDGAKILGAKILVSGGGRCNVTHEAVAAADFFGNRRIIKNVLAAWSVERTIEWFAGLGVELKREATGKLFPTTDKARTVLNALLERCHGLSVEIQTGRRVSGIERADGGFVVRHSEGAIAAKAVVLATGGRSLPKSGSDGSGYALARSLGHSLTSTVPALVPLVLQETMFHRMLSGLSQDVALTTVVGGKPVDFRRGSLLWTHFGVSGPVVMDASRFWTLAREQGEQADVSVSLVPEWTPEAGTDLVHGTGGGQSAKVARQDVGAHSAGALGGGCLHLSRCRCTDPHGAGASRRTGRGGRGLDPAASPRGDGPWVEPCRSDGRRHSPRGDQLSDHGIEVGSAGCI